MTPIFVFRKLKTRLIWFLVASGFDMYIFRLSFLERSFCGKTRMATASSSEVIGSVRGSITVGGETGSVTIPYPARALATLSFKRPSRTLAGVLRGGGQRWQSAGVD